ncbi:MAG TPA: N-acetylmuramoyl-L-alanine amidase [Candidatus Eisenbacteria bacterium]|nr:N-acetylmuramoyl-L-alanine amidase [Candidatus Eisenbacteria bacterium]
MVAGLCVALSAYAEAPRELRRIDLKPAPDGTVVVIELSRPSIPRFGVVRDEQGRLQRIHVDLPAGTTLAPGVTRQGASDPPVARVRVGLVDERPRVVIEVDGARDYRIERDAEPGTIALSVIGARASPAGASAAPPAEPGRAVKIPPPQRAEAPRPRSAKRSPPLKIVLDPGHGGDDPGAEGFAVEKEATLDIARRLATLLRARLRAEIVLTRDDDATLPLKDRTALANAEDADLFVSIHANANPTGTLRGVETYYLDNSTDRGTLRLAEMENGLDLLKPKAGSSDLRYILSDLVQVGKLGESARLARSIQRGVVAELRRNYTGVVDLGVKRGPFYVLVGAYMPCVLVETAFVSHPVEGRRLAREDYRQEIAVGLYTGIARYLDEGSRRRTL